MDSDDDSTNENNSGLLRYRSAPSSFLANFCSDIIGADDDDDHHHKRVKISTIETETQWFMTSGQQQSNSQFSSHVLKDNSNDFALNSPQLPPHPQYPRSNAITQLNGGFLFRVQNSNLMRQNSSPAGFFSHLSPQNANGYAGSAFPNGASTGTSAVLSPSSNRFSSGNGIPSNLGMMLSRISESENENPIPGRTNNINIPDPEPDHQKLSNASNNRESQLYCPPLPFSSRNNNNNSSKYSHNFTGFKTEIENDHQGLFSDNHQGGEPRRNRSPMLSHHLSLPKISGEIVAMEKLLQFRDTTTVPCKIRAKRGCATHPRSIAERVRRTRISERMKKLQELVPNMDKQTNTADMLDLAVHYIKDLRKQYKTLSEFRANCRCSDTHKSVSVVDHEEF